MHLLNQSTGCVSFEDICFYIIIEWRDWGLIGVGVCVRGKRRRGTGYIWYPGFPLYHCHTQTHKHTRARVCEREKESRTRISNFHGWASDTHSLPRRYCLNHNCWSFGQYVTQHNRLENLKAAASLSPLWLFNPVDTHTWHSLDHCLVYIFSLWAVFVPAYIIWKRFMRHSVYR